MAADGDGEGRWRPRVVDVGQECAHLRELRRESERPPRHLGVEAPAWRGDPAARSARLMLQRMARRSCAGLALSSTLADTRRKPAVTAMSWKSKFRSFGCPMFCGVKSWKCHGLRGGVAVEQVGAATAHRDAKAVSGSAAARPHRWRRRFVFLPDCRHTAGAAAAFGQSRPNEPTNPRLNPDPGPSCESHLPCSRSRSLPAASSPVCCCSRPRSRNVRVSGCRRGAFQAPPDTSMP